MSLAFVMAAVSGFVDGLGISTIAGVFPSFMSGNTTGAGVALGVGDLGTLARIGTAIPLYVLAVTVGALVFTRWTRARPVIWAVVLILLSGFIVAATLLPPVPSTGFALSSIPILACLVLPMGLLNMSLRRVAGTTIGLGYVTGTLVSLGESIAAVIARKASGTPVILFSGLWISFFLAAALGGLAASRIGPWAAGVPILAMLVLLLCDRATRPRILVVHN
jgi:uncharacterized membrane protein YoaK (UPF0700 family)